MIILTIRTDNPQAEVGLYDDTRQLAYIAWQAHRQLAETLHVKIRELLDSQQLAFSGIEAVAVYHGPGSFTGLRIGISVANALASSYNLPIAGSGGDNWINAGIKDLKSEPHHAAIVPEYGAPVHITARRK